MIYYFLMTDICHLHLICVVCFALYEYLMNLIAFRHYQIKFLQITVSLKDVVCILSYDTCKHMSVEKKKKNALFQGTSASWHNWNNKLSGMLNWINISNHVCPPRSLNTLLRNAGTRIPWSSIQAGFLQRRNPICGLAFFFFFIRNTLVFTKCQEDSLLFCSQHTHTKCLHIIKEKVITKVIYYLSKFLVFYSRFHYFQC